MKKILLIIVLSLFPIFSSYGDENGSSITHGPYPTKLFEKGKFYFEKNLDENFPLIFILEYCKNNEKVKLVVDKYAADGADIIEHPEKNIDIDVRSIFFYTVQKKKYVFVILKRGVTHRAIGIYGDSYQIYAYTKNENGFLVLDKEITNDNNLSGIEGTSDWKESHFKYKTADQVKAYIKKTYSN